MWNINTVSLLGVVFLCVTTSATDKRILLSDPAYVAQQLNHLQSELQDMKVQVDSQKQTIDILQHTILSIQSNASTQKQTIDIQHQDLLGLKSNVSSQKHTIDIQQQTISSQQLAIQKVLSEGSGKSTAYTRWGRKDCPVRNGTHLVYSGYVGGAYYTHPGGASNSLCMPDDPTPGQNPYQTNPGFIYGAEIQQGHEVFGLPQNDEDVACAVCRTSVHTTSVMIPGRTACYPGWVEAYSGLIVGGYTPAASNTDYICMDRHPQPVPGGQTDDDGQIFRPVVTKCGSLPCPPYEDDKLVPCVVCMM